jgi:DNA-binding NarL/FixJ family response regulator
MNQKNNAGRIRTMIVEDQFVVRVGLSAIINSQPDMVNVAETGNGLQAVALFEEHQPDVTLMDLRLPGLSGIDAITAILGKFRARGSWYCLRTAEPRMCFAPSRPGRARTF